jgi:methylmalonyl-CoA mutase
MSIFTPSTNPWAAVAWSDWLKAIGPELAARDLSGVLCPPTDAPTPRPLRSVARAWKLVGEDELEPVACAIHISAPSAADELAQGLAALTQAWQDHSGIVRVGMPSGLQLFSAIAKLRAFRILATAQAQATGRPIPVIRVLVDPGQTADPASAHSLVRMTLGALAGVLGLADEVEFIPDSRLEDATWRTQAIGHILREEASLRSVIDPTAGSHLVETLTLQMAKAAWAIYRPGEELPETALPSTTATADDRGLPGLPPFIRGPYASMYLKHPWTLRQYAGFSTAEATNAFFRAALADGQTGLSVAFDLPTHRGYDSDHPRVTGDVGKAGVAIDSVEDMKRLFDAIPLGRTSVSMTMNGAVLPILAFFIVAAEEQGVPASALSGTIQNDILKEYMVRNTYIYPPAPSLRIVSDIMAWLSSSAPKFNSISVSGYHMHEAGATAGQELAYTLANGLAYLNAGRAAGVDADTLASRMSFFWAQGMDYITEIAKLRAARGLWARLLWDLGVRSPKALALRCHCQTSGWSLTRHDPINNVIRTTLEALSAVHGHTQSLHTNSLDEAVALPSDSAARIARHTQLILQTETDSCTVVDPWGGSLEVEQRTVALAEEAMALIAEIDAAGGMIAAISKGIPQRRIEQAAATRQGNIDAGNDRIVGVNCYQRQEDQPIEIRNIDNRAVREAQLDRLQELRSSRDLDRVAASLMAIETGARDPQTNLLALAIEAARARATLGEISTALENVFTRHNAVTQVPSGAYGAGMTQDDELDSVRRRVASFAEAQGRRPRILVAKMGQDGHDRGAKVVAGAFADFGFDVDLAPLFRTPEEVCRQALDNDVHVIGISTLAGAHTTLVPELLALLQAQDAGHIRVVVGGIIPDADHPFLTSLGVSAIFGPGSRLPDCANRVLDRLAEL